MDNLRNSILEDWGLGDWYLRMHMIAEMLDNYKDASGAETGEDVLCDDAIALVLKISRILNNLINNNYPNLNNLCDPIAACNLKGLEYELNLK